MRHLYHLVVLGFCVYLKLNNFEYMPDASSGQHINTTCPGYVGTGRTFGSNDIISAIEPLLDLFLSGIIVTLMSALLAKYMTWQRQGQMQRAFMLRNIKQDKESRSTRCVLFVSVMV